jgi:hypothetical protein
LKELLTWGTLDPVAAFLLARANMIDRPQAESEALVYYAELAGGVEPNDALDPRRIASWIEARRPEAGTPISTREFSLDAQLERNASAYTIQQLIVSPIDDESTLLWIDPAGHTVARTERPANWPETTRAYDFELNVNEAIVRGRPYLLYREGQL